MAIQPLRIDVKQPVLDDLHDRLARTRFTTGINEAGWECGTSLDYLKDLCRYWQREFDWREQERSLNRFTQFRCDVDGVGLHFIHARGKGHNPIPLLLVHGWPDTFARFVKAIPLLTDPAAHGAALEPSFDVVAPSLPGFGFSDKPQKAGLTFRFGDLLNKLMVKELGYQRFAVQGGDWGGMVAEQTARSHASSVIGIQLTDVPFFHMFQKPHDLTAAEENYLKKMELFQQKEGAYALIQSTRPQTLACGLNDSPAGLAAWIVEKFRAWSDCNGDLERRFSRDEILTTIMIYWATQTIESSFLPYYDLANAGPLRWTSEALKTWLGSTKVPAGFALFPNDLVTPPRAWAERFFNIQRWTEMPRGGHFAAFEEPELFVQDLRSMFGPLWTNEKRIV